MWFIFVFFLFLKNTKKTFPLSCMCAFAHFLRNQPQLISCSPVSPVPFGILWPRLSCVPRNFLHPTLRNVSDDDSEIKDRVNFFYSLRRKTTHPKSSFSVPNKRFFFPFFISLCVFSPPHLYIVDHLKECDAGRLFYSPLVLFSLSFPVNLFH